MYDMKALYQAASVEEAVALRLEHPEAQIIAGGSDVLGQMREGKRAGAELISIYGIDALLWICKLIQTARNTAQYPVHETGQLSEALFLRKLYRLVADSRIRNLIHVFQLINRHSQQITDHRLLFLHRHFRKMVDDGIQLQSALQSSFTKAGQECAFLLIQILVSLQHTTECHMA